MCENHKIKWFSHKQTQDKVLQTSPLSGALEESRPVYTVKTLPRNVVTTRDSVSQLTPTGLMPEDSDYG